MFFVLLPTHVCLPSVLQDFSSKKEKRESFLHICNSVFEVLYRISETCTNASGLNLPALRTTKDDANHHWLSMCSHSEVCFFFNMSHDYSKIEKKGTCEVHSLAQGKQVTEYNNMETMGVNT